MLFSPQKNNKLITQDINLELAELQGELDDQTAKITLAKFLRYNLPLAVDWVGGVKLAPYQVAALKGFFLRNYSMCVFGRGCSKTYLAALACMFIPMFEPGTNTILVGPTFRSARNIFSYMEKIQNSPEAILLRQCLGVKSKRNDMWEWEINGGLVRAIPLNGEKVRGLRANLLILDEALLLSEDIIKNVLMPFLVAPSDIKQRMIVREKEDEQIKKGLMKESDREVFNSNSRMIVLSSASYTFEYLYTLYKDWTEKIYDEETKDSATYFIQQASWDSVPADFIEKKVIEEAQSTDELHPAFKREYCAQFVDGSDSYFNAKKMHQLTIEDGKNPSIKLKGDKDKKYILSVDPNHSASASGDFFAMAVIELSENDEKGVLVHNYAKAGVELKEHIKYFYYLLTNFNIVMVCVDNADSTFIQAANESALFQKNRLKINTIEYDGSLQGEEHVQMLKEIRKQYNLSEKKICVRHIFNQESIRRINEQMQTWINTNRIHFGSRLERSDDYESIIKEELNFPFDEKNGKIEGKDSSGQFIVDLVSTQDDLMSLVKKQCALIEVRSSPTGGQVFDLPTSLKRNTSANRARKDNYTALLLGIEGASAYFNLMSEPVEVRSKTLWTPMMMGRSTL